MTASPRLRHQALTFVAENCLIERLWFKSQISRLQSGALASHSYSLLSGGPICVFAEPSPTPSPIVSHIPRDPVDSSAIAKIGYSKRRHILEIEFINGAVYRYLNVPLGVYRDLMSAESKARFYDSKIRRHYHSVLVRSQQKAKTTK